VDDTDEPVVEIDYRVCRRCRLGWVELPFTLPAYQRSGLAAAALAALRDEHPDVCWCTLGGHERDAVSLLDRRRRRRARRLPAA